MQNLDVGGADLSDHHPVSFSMPFRKPAPERRQVLVRNIKDMDMDAFQQDIRNSCLCNNPSDDITHLVNQYNTTLSNILDTHAPARSKTITIKPQSPWFTEEIRIAKRDRRRAERRWRSTRLSVHHEIYRTECRRVSKLCRDARKEYYCSRIEDCGTDQRKIFQIASDLMNKRKDTSLPSSCSSQELAEDFAEFFMDKISRIRMSFESNSSQPSNDSDSDQMDIPRLQILSPTTNDELKKIITGGN